MANLKYKIAKRTLRLGGKNPREVYLAQPVIIGKISTEEFIKEVSDGSTVDPADVKAVLSRIHTVISRLTARGLSVECGELGTFRPSFGSKSFATPKEVTSSAIRPAKIVFTPKPAFKDSLRSSGFELYRPAKADGDDSATAPKTPDNSSGSSSGSSDTGNSAGGGGVGF